MHNRHPALICKGSANIISSGNNSLAGGHGGNPAIYVPQGSTLTISGYGTLDVKGCQVGAGIGSGDAKKYKNSGNIIIKSGRVNAYGDSQSAGIGSTQTGTCGDIAIEGGEVYAYGGFDGAGIGSGYYGKCGPSVISNKIKSLDMKNPGASGKNLREVLFGETIEFGTPQQSLNLLLYLLETLEYDYDEVWQKIHYEIYDNGKAFTITPLTK